MNRTTKIITITVLILSIVLVSCANTSKSEEIEDEQQTTEIDYEYIEESERMDDYIEYEVSEWINDCADEDDIIEGDELIDLVFESYTHNEILDYFGDELLEHVFERYTLDDIVKYYKRGDGEIYSDIVTDTMGICDEIEAQGCYDAFGSLFYVMDAIGYAPSLMMGEYCIDKENDIIHRTDKDCVSKIPYANMSFTLRGRNRYELKEYLNNYGYYELCEQCFENKQ